MNKAQIHSGEAFLRAGRVTGNHAVVLAVLDQSQRVFFGLVLGPSRTQARRGARRCSQQRKDCERLERASRRSMRLTDRLDESRASVPDAKPHFRQTHTLFQAFVFEKHLHCHNQHCESKLRLSAEETKQFTADNANACPHSDMQRTRNGGHCCKSIVLQSQGRNADALPVASGCLHSLPSACVDNETLQNLACTEAACPSKHENSDVLDCMSVSERSTNEHWHQVVQTLTCSRGQTEKKEFCRLCVQIRVNQLIQDKLELQPVLAHAVLLQQLVLFDAVCECCTKEFFKLCMRSFQCVVTKTNESLSPIGLASVKDDSDSDFDVVSVPVVSSSSDQNNSRHKWIC